VHRVVFVLFPDVQSLDVTGPLEVFATANAECIPDQDFYRFTFASVAGGSIRTSSGLSIETARLATVRKVDTLIVAGGQGTRQARRDHKLLASLETLASRAGRVASICTGAFLLAELGVLDGLRVATHWRWAEALARSHPTLEVDPAAMFVQSGKYWTSAGVTSGIDLALALVAEDHGASLARGVARDLVVYVQRSGGQSQFTGIDLAPTNVSTRWDELVSWIKVHLEDDLSVPALAQRIHLSPRQFARVFNETFASTPGSFVESIRVQEACRLLEESELQTHVIAAQCGFGTVETMHRVFRRRLDTTPNRHRSHFRTKQNVSSHTMTSGPNSGDSRRKP
jgi:transcriptional regulator GlxA family with amidase domain